MTSVGSSSIDVASIVSSLVANKRAAPDKRIAAQRSEATTQLSALGTFTSALNAIKNAAATLADGSAFAATKATSSDDTAVTVTADKTAKPTSYHIDVITLAAAQKTVSGAYSDSTTPAGTGTMTIQTSKGTMHLDVSGANSSLQAIRDSINKASDNPGVSATIVTGTDGAHLVLSSKGTGTANAYSVSVSGGDGKLGALAFDPAVDTAATRAQDAVFDVDGIRATSTGNTVPGAIDGLTLSLEKTGGNDVIVSRDTSAVTGAAKSLVTAYNNFVTTYKTLTKYDQTTNEVGALIGDATVTSIKGQLSALLGARTHGNGGLSSLSDVGIRFQVDGTLSLDADKLQNALTVDPDAVSNLMSGNDGVVGKLSATITTSVASNGILSVRSGNLNHHIEDLDVEKSDLDTKMDAYEKQLTTRYTALDALMTKLGNTSNFLTQQFAALTKSQ
jgi:flagellar hook-associated protein 2